MDLLLLGIQGAGKGTQARRIVSEYGYELFETGAELRRIAASGSELGTTISSYIDKGFLVPPEMIMEVVREAIASKSPTAKLLFDGIPRNVAQKALFDPILAEYHRPFRCLKLLLPRDIAIDRLRHRALTENRIDDAKDEFILRRMTIFETETRPMIEEYRRQGIVDDISGVGTSDEVFHAIEQVFARLGIAKCVRAGSVH